MRKNPLYLWLLMAFLPMLGIAVSARAAEPETPPSNKVKVEINLASAKLEDFTKIITEQTGILFSYESSMSDVGLGDLRFRKSEYRLSDILDRVLSPKGITYKVVDKTIVLSYDKSGTQSDSGEFVVSGSVTDESGSPLAGASVQIKGTTSGVNADLDGKYSVTVRKGDVLIYSFIGFSEVEEVVGRSSVIDVVMSMQTNYLEDVVVIGYGTQTRKTLTSSVAKVSGDDISSLPVNSVGDALKGKISGVRISSANNQPGEDPVFLIRGGSSINQSNAPIVIVDGVRREMSGLNANDIESVEILKDAASAGIYGASASNGVVLVTTKKGSKHKGPQVMFEAQGAWTSPATSFDLMSAKDYIVTMRNMLNECPGYTYGQSVLSGANSAGIGNGETSIWTTRYLKDGEVVPEGWQSVPDPVDPSKTIIFQDNDQQKQWFRDSYWMQYYVGVNGGNDRVTYAASASYMDDGGVGVNTGYNRFTFHGNTSFKITDKLTVGTTFDYSQAAGDELPSSGIGNYWTTVGRGMFMPATHRDWLPDGTPAQGTNNTTISAAWFKEYYTYKYVSRRSTANFNLKWDIIDGLTFFAQIANHNNYRINNQFLAGNAISNLRQTYEGWGQTNRLSFQTYLNYTKTFKEKHNFSAMVGYDLMYRTVNSLGITVDGAESDKTPTIAAGPNVKTHTDVNTPWSQVSWFGRINYDYKQRYIVSFTMRADGSSLFAAGNRWGYFPAASAGWIISSEDFWNVKKFDLLKLRLSYGLTGNNNIGYYDTLGSYTATGKYNGGGTTISSSLPNETLTWEQTRQFDLGVDMSFFDSRLNISADYYDKVSDNLLFDVSLPETSGYSSAKQNIGSIRFYGLELAISSVNISKKDFSWTTDFTYSFNANRVLSLPDEYYYKDLNGNDAWRIGGYRMSESGYRFGGIAVGEPMGRIYGYKPAYIIETEAQADAALYDSNSHGYRRSDGKSIAGRKDVGDYEWMDREGSALTADGKAQINGEDMFLLGNVVPHSVGGLGNTFKLKGFALSIYLDYALGHSIYNYQYTRCFQTSMGNCNWNLVYDVLNTWRKPGDDTDLARLTPNDADGGNRNYSRISSVNVQKGNYLCLRDVSISYELPKKAVKKIGFAGLTFTVSGNTLCYWTGVKGISPESGSVGSGTGMYTATNTSSTSFSIYPPARKVLFGIKAIF